MQSVENYLNCLYAKNVVSKGQRFTTVAEIARKTNLPFTIVAKRVGTENIRVKDSSSKFIAALYDINPRVNPKRADRIRARILSETQRYSRRAQFPYEEKSQRTTRQKTRRIIERESIGRQRIVLTEPNIIEDQPDKKRLAKYLARWSPNTKPEPEAFDLIKNVSIEPSAEGALRRELNVLSKGVEQESVTRRQLTDKVKNVLQEKYSNCENFECVIGIPVVGFGDQSRVIEQTLDQLSKQINPLKTLCIFLINRPFDQIPDQTSTNLAQKISPLDGNISYCVVDSSIQTPINMGEVRSAIFDGYLASLPNKSQTNLEVKTFVVMDDDVTKLSPDWLNMTVNILKTNQGIDLITGATNFDNDDLTIFPALLNSEKVRCVVARKILNEFSRKTLSGAKLTRDDRNTFCEYLFDKDIVQGVFLSGFAVRASAYEAIYGFPAKDEITRFIRQVSLLGLNQNKLNIGFCEQLETSVDPRRAIATFCRDNSPVVGQWRGSFPFRTDVVDTARTLVMETTSPRNTSKLLTKMISETFDFFKINDPNMRQTLLVGINL